MKTALPTARALAVEGPAPERWITLYRSESTYFADSAVQRSEVTSVVTEWNEFKNPDFASLVKQLKSKAVFDGRNLYDPYTVTQYGLTYYGIGRPGTQVA